ncbi:MAG TPA: PIN domain-containing protein [Allosphingosinicella sp.]|jgi:tRNA(fMet)-specific endonuclease VapC
MRFLLDSNIFIQAMVKGDRHLKRQMRIHLSQIALSTIVQYELYSGSRQSRRRREQIEGIEELALRLLPFDSADAQAAGEIRAELKRKGTPIGPYDLLIAGQARARGLTVVTRNVGEFRRVEGLAVEEWAA